jgi:LPXTG-motif cell wall-anchored protein
MRSIFQMGFSQEVFGPRLGLSFANLRAGWDQYAPEVRTDLKAVRDAAFSTPAGTPAQPVSSPTNLAYKPAPSSGVPTGLLVVGGLALAGGAAYYFYSKKK